jgi:peptidoglycan/LPS O-acetylase OafA/YrhL
MLLFFTLSGYLMGKGFYTGKYDLSRPGVTLYLRNRFLRIFPLMFVVGLLTTIWQSPQLLSAPQTAVRILLFVFNGVGGTVSNGVFWSLSTEWQFYLLVPATFAIALVVTRLLAPTAKVLLPVATVLVFVLGFVIRQYLWIHHGGAESRHLYTYPSLFGNIDVFLLGFLANWWVPRLARIASLVRAASPLLLIGIYLAYSSISFQPMVNGSQQWYPFAVILPGATAVAMVPVLVGCELWNRKARLRKLSQRKTGFVLYWLGTLTYPVYLVHCSILNGVQLGMPHQTYAAKWAIATILVILIAWILHMSVEKPVLDWRRHRATQAEKSGASETGQVGLTKAIGREHAATLARAEISRQIKAFGKRIADSSKAEDLQQEGFSSDMPQAVTAKQGLLAAQQADLLGHVKETDQRAG